MITDKSNEEIATTTLVATTRTILENNEATFYELVRRIPKPKLMIIEATLRKVTSLHITSLLDAMANQKNLLDDTSFIHDMMFPFAALEAVRIGKISSLQFGTLMALWGSLDTILPKSTEQKDQLKPEFVPLFTIDGEKNPRATVLLIFCLQPSSILTTLVVKTPEDLLNGIYDKAIHLEQSEQGFWVIENSSPQTTSGETITQRIKSAVDVKFLAFKADDKREMIPSFGLQQVFLDVAFPHAVRINPVIGDSTPIDIRKGSAERYRDMALPFPGNELPKVADNYTAPSALDFMFHDRYHAVRASRVTPKETAHYVAIGDKLQMMQQRYGLAAKEFSKRHEEHIRLLPEFARTIEKLSPDKQCEVTELVFKKFNQEIAIINKLKSMRKSTGQLKFRIWDMERQASGGLFDGPENTELEKLKRIIISIQVDLFVLGVLPGTVELSKYSARKAAHAVLEVVKPETDALTTMQKQIIQGREVLGFLRQTQKPAQRSFDDAILDDAPAFLFSS